MSKPKNDMQVLRNSVCALTWDELYYQRELTKVQMNKGIESAKLLNKMVLEEIKDREEKRKIENGKTKNTLH